MRLYLDASSRAFRGAAPANASPGAPLTPGQIAGTVTLDVSDQDWQTIYRPAWLAAQEAGQDLIVATDGSTTGTAHAQTPREQAYVLLANYLTTTTPTGAETVQALKTLIRVVRALV